MNERLLILTPSTTSTTAKTHPLLEAHQTRGQSHELASKLGERSVGHARSTMRSR